MINPALPSKDYYQEALSWITEHYKDKPVFQKHLQIMFLQHSALFHEINNLLQYRSLDTAQGRQLDIIGDLVGQPRVQAQAALYTFFGFLEDVTADTFGDLNDASIGGYWYSKGSPIGGNLSLDDETYRRMIRARILKNSSRGTTDDFLRFLDYVFGDGSLGSSGTYVETQDVGWFGYEGVVNVQGYTDGIAPGGLYWDGVTPLVNTGTPTVSVRFTRPLTLLEIWMLHAQIPDKDGNLTPFMLKPLGVELIFFDADGNQINPV